MLEISYNKKEVENFMDDDPVTESFEEFAEKVKELADITFTLHAPKANEVFLVGDFNNWKAAEENRLSRKNDGLWSTKIHLEPGRYHYKFVVDGNWVEDPFNPNKEICRMGTQNLRISRMDQNPLSPLIKTAGSDRNSNFLLCKFRSACSESDCAIFWRKALDEAGDDLSRRTNTFISVIPIY